MKQTAHSNGLVHLYVGDGKGKTTACMGLAVRAMGIGRKVLIAQFLKGRPTGELAPLETLGATLMRVKECDKFTFQMTPEEFQDNRRRHLEMMATVERALAVGEYDLVILDEVVDAVNAGVIPLADLVRAVDNRAKKVEVVLSGRNPTGELCELADYHTLFQCVKHPYQNGVAARAGIEF